MIVRIFRARIRKGRLADWQQKVEDHSIPWLECQDGLVAFYPGKPLDAECNKFSMTSIWRDVESLRNAVGDDWQKAVLLEDEGDLVQAVKMHHYKTFG